MNSSFHSNQQASSDFDADFAMPSMSSSASSSMSLNSSMVSTGGSSDSQRSPVDNNDDNHQDGSFHSSGGEPSEDNKTNEIASDADSRTLQYQLSHSHDEDRNQDIDIDLDDADAQSDGPDGDTSHEAGSLQNLPQTKSLLSACLAGPEEVQRTLSSEFDLNEDVVFYVLDKVLSWPEGDANDAILRAFLRDPRLDLSTNDWWILRNAARFGRAHFIRDALRALDCSPTEKWAIVTSNIRGLCTLSWACINNMSNVIDVLLEEVASQTHPSLTNQDLTTAIAFSRELGNADVYERLVKFTAQRNLPQHTPYAIDERFAHIV